MLLLACALHTAIAYSASKNLLVLGDSLSAEYGLTRGTGWVPLLDRRLKEEKRDDSIVNASISGDTTSGGRARLAPLLDKYRPATVVIELGANDALRGLPIASTEDNLRAMIKASQAVGAKVLLVGMQIPPNYGSDYSKGFADLYPKLAKEYKIGLVPFLLGGLMDKPQMFQSDRLHPVAAAQPILLDTVWPHLKPLLPK
ncbi:MAG: tesA [Herminiimonas sp.]|nr:tesA [Herminiimonas sp.]MDB5854696.1 tesA [Herminiimonas sp.]